MTHVSWIVLPLVLAADPVAGREPIRITVHPPAVELSTRSRSQQIAVTGEFDDGSTIDLTRQATFRVGNQFQFTKEGIVSAAADATGVLQVVLGKHKAEAPIRARGLDRPSPVSYRLDVVPLLSKAGCNQGTCHGNLTGKGGFRLSLRSDDPLFDLAALTRDAFGRRIDRANPSASLVVRKPAGLVPHEGGKRFAPGSPQHKTLEAWIASGANDDLGSVPTVERLEVYPPQRYLAAGSSAQQLVATAHLSDGTVRDVTAEASYDVSEPAHVQVSANGLVKAEQPIEVTIAVRFQKLRAVARLAFLADRPGFVWGKYPSNGPIDDLVYKKLRAIKVHPSAPAADAVFLRRVFLVGIGVLPTPAETREFLADNDPEKRNKLIDRLLDRPEFADMWALRWADVLRNEEKAMGTKGVWTFHRWLTRQFQDDAPMDQIVRDLITSSGSTWQSPGASLYRTNRDPTVLAETFGQVFLGFRLQCAKCHNHPFDVWRQDDYYGLAAFFAPIGRKQVTNVRRDRLDTHEINGDEIVYLSGAAQLEQPTSHEMMAPTPLGATPVRGDARQSLAQLADWVTTHPQFARNVANRVWYHLLGRGIVDAPDDFRDSNPPSNPELLDLLARELAASQMRIRPLVAMIMKSQTFARSSEPTATNRNDEANFARYLVRMPPGEVLLDSLSQALAAPESFSNAPAGIRAVQLPGARMGGQFVKVFGKPDRLLTCDCERSSATTLAQAIQMINGEVIQRKLTAPDNRIDRLIETKMADADAVRELYLAALSRYPTPAELKTALDHISSQRSAASKAGAGAALGTSRAFEDLAWALVNSKEFLLIH